MRLVTLRKHKTIGYVTAANDREAMRKARRFETPLLPGGCDHRWEMIGSTAMGSATYGCSRCGLVTRVRPR